MESHACQFDATPPIFIRADVLRIVAFPRALRRSSLPPGRRPAYDGGVLEVKIGTGAFTDILTAGGSFVSGGYNKKIDPTDDNPLDGRRCWSGLSGDFIRGLFEDREGNMWVATSDGLDRFHDVAIPTISVRQGLPKASVSCVLAARDGSVWLGTRDGLTRWNDGHVSIYRNQSRGLPDDSVESIFEDYRGRIWVSTDRGVASFENGNAAGYSFYVLEEQKGLIGGLYVSAKYQQAVIGRRLPDWVFKALNTDVGHYLGVLSLFGGVIGLVLVFVYFQVSYDGHVNRHVLQSTLWTVFFILTITALVGLEVVARVLSPDMFSEYFTQTDAWNAVTVGLAPGPVPRTYEGHTHWDMGFLFLRSDRICYWGEETRFALRRDQIIAIKLGPSTPNLLRSHRVYIAWRDLEGSTCGVFSLGSLAPESVLALRGRTKNLFAQLLQWHATSSPARPLPAPLDSLSAPKFGSVTGISPITIGKPKTVLKQMYLFGLLAAAVAVVAGLPFHLLSALTQILAVRGTAADGIGSGWYVVAVALSVIFLQYIPYFRYKEVPVLQANLETPVVQKQPTNEEAQRQVREHETVRS